MVYEARPSDRSAGEARASDRSTGDRPFAESNDVESSDSPLESLQLELADQLDLDFVLDLSVEPLGNEDLTRGSFVREPRREIRYGADRRIVEAPLEPHLTARCVAERDAGAEVEVVAALPPR